MNFAEPGWLFLLILLPLVAAGAVVTARLRRQQWSAFVAGRLRPRLLRRSSPVPRLVAFVCLLIAAALLIVALARPQTEEGIRSEEILGRNIIVAIDLSRSMTVSDLRPDRLSQAKAMTYELLEALPTDRVGIVGFAGSAYLFAPLTVDHAAVRETVTQLDSSWIPVGGSNLASGLELGIETLRETGQKQNALILLSDGEEHEGRIAAVAEEAKRSGVQVISIGFGTTRGDFIPEPRNRDGHYRDREGRKVVSRLEPAPLQRVAQVTGGRFAIASSGADIPAMVQTAISDLDRVRIAGRDRTEMVEHYQWFLFPAILLMMASVIAATRWRGVGGLGAAAAALCLAGFVQPLDAAALDEARQAMVDERFSDAARIFGGIADNDPDSEAARRMRLAQAEAAIREGDFATARMAFSEALLSSSSEVREAAHHGLGNTLFEVGWLRLSGGPRYPRTDQQPSEAPGGVFGRIMEGLLGLLNGAEPEDAPEDPDAEADESGETGEDELAAFDAMVRQRLAEWMQEENPPGSPSEGSTRFNELVTDWIDAVRHFDSADGHEDSEHNRVVVVRHLERIREILEEIEQASQQLQAIPQPGEGEPQPGEEGEGEDGEGQQGEQPDDEGQGDEQEGDDGPGGEREDEQGDGGEEEDPDARPGEDGEDGEEEEPGSRAKPGETPEETARRVLRENADLEKGTLGRDRVRYRRPEKDW